MRRLACVFTVAMLVSVVLAEEAPKAEPPQRWMWLMTNLTNPKGYDDAVALVQRSAKAGYTGIAVYDGKFAKFKLVPEHAAKLRDFRKACDDAKMKLIVCVAPMGYADELLANDPNLAEGMPVRDALFVVKSGKLVPDAEGVVIMNPSFEKNEGGKVAGWELSANMTVDTSNASDGNASVLLIDDGKPQGKIIQKLAVKPWHYYHVSVMVKTEGYTGKDNRVMILAPNGLALNWQPPYIHSAKEGWIPIPKTTDWARVDASFCSLDNTEVSLMIGRWDGKTGKIWFDDVKIEPGGFVNVVRRDSLPLKVASEDGKTIYEEGKDFSPVADPKLLKDPNPGYFTIWHDMPEVRIPEGGKLKEGDKVKVSYHFTTSAGKFGQMNVCFAEPKVYQLVEDQIKYVKENGKPDIYFMVHDEIRFHGWDDSCTKRNMTNGQMLADNVKRCTEIIEKVDPGKSILVWSDMFDEFHNAKKEEGGQPFNMYLAKGNGPWYGSWEGLPKQVGLVNWNGDNVKSYENFARMGHQQILSDNNPEKIVQRLKACKGLEGIVGVMYTTWTGDYGQNVEKYVEAVKKWEKESEGFRK